MQNQKKTVAIALAVVLIIAFVFLLTQRQTKPKTSNETVNGVITIIEELDQKPDSIK